MKPALPSFHFRAHAFPVATVLLAFCVPLLKYGLQIPIFFFIASWFVYPKEAVRSRIAAAVVFAGIYIFHLIGLRNTEHFDLAIPDLTEKLSLLLFPVLFAFSRPLPVRFRRGAIIAFAAGTCLSVGVSFLTSAIDYSRSGDPAAFYMSAFSPVFHPSYLAMYINFAIAILLTAVGTPYIRRRGRVLAWVAITFLSLSLVFPTSKMGFITYGLLVGFYLLKWAVSRTFFTYRTALLVAISVATMLMIRFDPIAQSRIQSAVEYADGEQPIVEEHQEESNAARIYAWKAAWAEIRQHPFGVGTGDINVQLRERFRAEGLDALAEKDLNPHNQYLQSAMALGVPALLWFLASLLFPFARIFRTRDWLYAFFILLIALNLCVESMLEKQAGIVFFAFFNALLWFNPLPPRNK